MDRRAWCKGVDTGTLHPDSLRQTIAQYDKQHPYFNFLLDGAKQLCSGDPKNPIIQRTTQEILQFWMNSFGQVARGKERLSMPTLVWPDKTQKKLTAWVGFEL